MVQYSLQEVGIILLDFGNVINGRELATFTPILTLSSVLILVRMGLYWRREIWIITIKFWSITESKESPTFYKYSGRGEIVTLSLEREILTSGNGNEAIELKNVNLDLNDLLVRGCELAARLSEK